MSVIEKFSMILARDLNGAIGQAGGLPWDCRNDLNWYKQITNKYLVAVCGRKTYDSLPEVVKSRHNFIVVTNDKELAKQSACPTLKYCNLQDAIKEIRQTTQMIGLGVVCLGGAEIYRQLMPLVSTVYITTVFTSSVTVDTHFNEFSGEWERVNSEIYEDCFCVELERKNG